MVQPLFYLFIISLFSVTLSMLRYRSRFVLSSSTMVPSSKYALAAASANSWFGCAHRTKSDKSATLRSDSILLTTFGFILATAIGARPKPEICFLPRRLKWTLLSKERYGDSLSFTWIEHPTFQLRGGHSTTGLSPPHLKHWRPCSCRAIRWLGQFFTAICWLGLSTAICWGK